MESRSAGVANPQFPHSWDLLAYKKKIHSFSDKRRSQLQQITAIAAHEITEHKMVWIPQLNRLQVTLELRKSTHAHGPPFQFHNVGGILGYEGQIRASIALRQLSLPDTDVDVSKLSRFPKFPTPQVRAYEIREIHQQLLKMFL